MSYAPLLVEVLVSPRFHMCRARWSVSVALFALGLAGCPAATDADEDGFTVEQGDCNDEDAAMSPGQDEVPYNGKDDDCSSGDLVDVDDDGHNASQVGGDDCDDEDPVVFTGSVEVCDGLDQDCDSKPDDGLASFDYLADTDGDGYGAGDIVSDCSELPPEGYVVDGGVYDCDDTDAAISPDAVETCDGVDEDCDLAIDNGFDGDGDGVTTCGPDGDEAGVADNDCDDADDTKYPGAAEVCNGIDEDCDGSVLDEAADEDGDGFTPCNGDCDDTAAEANPDGTEVCDGLDNDCVDGLPVDEVDGDSDGTLLCAGDCDDAEPAVFPTNPEVCDGLDNDCADGVPVDEADADSDGTRLCDADCDDTQAAMFPGNTEVCDGLDNDCDTLLPTDEVDVDFDGYLVCAGFVDSLVGFLGGEDCDDAQASVFPTAPELCDGLDNDCDLSTTDEVDADADGVRVCDGDCDDTRATVAPSAPEVCDGLDNDCADGVPTDEVDGDLDGHILCTGFVDESLGLLGGDDCDDAEASRAPSLLEVCDGLDNDCDTSVPTDETDGDLDLYVSCGSFVDEGLGLLGGGDCDDALALTFPGATETCDGADNDCDTAVPADETDGDADGSRLCDGDCDDALAASFPGNTEVCDGIDNDCLAGVPTDEADADSDLYLACTSFVDAGLGWLGGDDCAAADGSINPGATEACDGIDNNCVGGPDFDLAGEVDFDADGDLSCSDCDDNDDARATTLTESCDGIDNDCVDGLPGDEVDADSDTFLACAECDDAHLTASPIGSEVCDGLDNDCAGGVPTDEADADDDDYVSCTGFVDASVGLLGGDDCEDNVPAVHPGAVDACDGADTDCSSGTSTPAPGDAEADDDGDGYVECSTWVDIGIGLTGGDDCDDDDDANHPSHPEVCDFQDNDCDGLADAADTADYEDADFDDDGDPMLGCGGLDCDDTDPTVDGVDTDLDNVSPCGGDCDDLDFFQRPIGGAPPSASPWAAHTEFCDGRDNDCDGVADPTDADTTADGDGDGQAGIACGGPDCDDSDPHIFQLTEVTSGYQVECEPAVRPGEWFEWWHSRVELPWYFFDSASGLHYLYFRGHVPTPEQKLGFVSSLDGTTWDDAAPTTALAPALSPAWDSDALAAPAVIFVPGFTRPYLMYYHAKSISQANPRHLGLATATSPEGPFERLDPVSSAALTAPVLSPGTTGQSDATNVSQVSAWYDSATTTIHLWYLAQGATPNPSTSFVHATSTDGVTFTKTDTALPGTPDWVFAPGVTGQWDSARLARPFVMENGDPLDTDHPLEIFYTGTNSTASTAIRSMGVAYGEDTLTWDRCDRNPVLANPANAVHFGGKESAFGTAYFASSTDIADPPGAGEYHLFYTGRTLDAADPYGSTAQNSTGEAAYIGQAINVAPEVSGTPLVVGPTVSASGTISDTAPAGVQISVTFVGPSTVGPVAATVDAAPDPLSTAVQTTTWSLAPQPLASGTWTVEIVALDAGCAARRTSSVVVVP